MTALLDHIEGPEDLSKLKPAELAKLADEIRYFLVQNVAKTGGHLGPNLGVVELSIALHRVFSSPSDTFIFDTGHQSYVHKILTGRKDFQALRSAQGLSGYPCREESIHDVVENSHASTALSWAQGVAEAKYRAGDKTWTVAVIGDGALTGGLAWEALNNIASRRELRLIIIVNDNGRSYAPTIGGLAQHLDALRTSPAYEGALNWGKRHLQARGRLGDITYDALHGLKTGIKDVFSHHGVFANLGIKYTGPINGHDIGAIEFALKRAQDYRGPVIVHVNTEKGRGYTPAEQHEGDRFHAVGKIHPETGLPVKKERFGWTAVFADEILQIARRREDVVAISAAMVEPVGLKLLRDEVPERVIDVGIAEQHALTLAAGLSYGGMHPVVALYATFLNRAYDQLLLDVALHKQAVTVVLDRAGITGNDGASHNGMWDIAMCAGIPGIALAAPRDEATLRKQLNQAVNNETQPTVIRYAKGQIPGGYAVIDSIDGLDILYQDLQSHPEGKKIRIIAVGALVGEGLSLAEKLVAAGYSVQVVDPGWLLPINQRLIDEATDWDHYITIEDGLAHGGFGDSLREAIKLGEGYPAVNVYGIKKEFISTDERETILERHCLTADTIYQDLKENHRF